MAAFHVLDKAGLSKKTSKYSKEWLQNVKVGGLLNSIIIQ
jgi:hypothetical protein